MDTGPFNIYSIGGLIAMTALSLVPYVYLVVAAALRRLDPAIEEAARVCGTPPLRTLFRVTLPAIAPALAGAVPRGAGCGDRVVLRADRARHGSAGRGDLRLYLPSARQLSAEHRERARTGRDAYRWSCRCCCGRSGWSRARAPRGDRRAWHAGGAAARSDAGEIRRGLLDVAVSAWPLRAAGCRARAGVAAAFLDAGDRLVVAVARQLPRRATGPTPPRGRRW